MSLSHVAAAPVRHEAAAVLRPEAWQRRASLHATVAILLCTPCRDVEAASGGLKTLMPGAQVTRLDLPMPAGRDASGERERARALRRAFAEIEADVYLLVEDETVDAAAALAAVRAVERDGLDLVTVTPLAAPPADAGDRLLGLVIAFLFGRGGHHGPSATRACSRRFAKTYRGRGDLDLALHALRLRLPVGEVASLASPPPRAARPARSFRDWMALLRLAARLLAEERPRRTFGVLGLGGIAAGLGAAVPSLDLHGMRPAFPDGPAAAVSLGLIGIGAGGVAAGLLLDTLAKARQDVSRLGLQAVPRRLGEDEGGPGWGAAPAQSSVS